MSQRLRRIGQRIRQSIRRGGGEIAIQLSAPTGYRDAGICAFNKKDALHFRKTLTGKVKVKKVRIEWGGKKRGSVFCLYKRKGR